MSNTIRLETAEGGLIKLLKKNKNKKTSHHNFNTKEVFLFDRKLDQFTCWF